MERVKLGNRNPQGALRWNPEQNLERNTKNIFSKKKKDYLECWKLMSIVG